MELDGVQIIRTMKCLSQAIGYLELGMTRQAMAALQRVGEPGPFAALVEMLRGEVARREDRLDDAAHSFEAAAQMLPEPGNRAIWLALSGFYRQTGHTNQAVESLARARGAGPPSAKPKPN
jgi:predicted Zn-dependent protease